MAKTSRKKRKPSKPYTSYPLTAHNNGQWCKKIRGRIHFFGVWSSPQAALDNYLEVATYLHGGREPHYSDIPHDALTVKDVCNRFLTYQLQKVDASEISARWFEDCRRVVTGFADCIGASRAVTDLIPDNFQRFRRKILQNGLDGKGKGLSLLLRPNHGNGRSLKKT